VLLRESRGVIYCGLQAVRLRAPRHHDTPSAALESHRVPTAEWTIQQFRNSLPLDARYRFVLHDRDGIFAPAVDDSLHSMLLQVLKTPVRAPQANAYCERLIGTVRRECLDWMIPLNELRWALDCPMIRRTNRH